MLEPPRRRHVLCGTFGRFTAGHSQSRTGDSLGVDSGFFFVHKSHLSSNLDHLSKVTPKRGGIFRRETSNISLGPGRTGGELGPGPSRTGGTPQHPTSNIQLAGPQTPPPCEVQVVGGPGRTGGFAVAALRADFVWPLAPLESLLGCGAGRTGIPSATWEREETAPPFHSDVPIPPARSSYPWTEGPLKNTVDPHERNEN